METLLKLRRTLPTAVCGQPQVINRLLDAVERRELNVTPQVGTREKFIFAGSTGVGKTSVALALADSLFGPGHLARFDCSEFKTLSRYDELFGSADGKPGRFLQAWQAVPEGVWLFDEIEKAHRDFFHIFLQTVDAARLTLADGRVLDLRGVYFICTTNLGSAALVGRDHLPFTSLEAHVAKVLQRELGAEICGRFRRPFVFRPLSREVQAEIARGLLEEIVEFNRQQGRMVEIAPEVVPFLVHHGYSSKFGARPLRQAIEELVGNPIKQSLLAGRDGCGRLALNGQTLELT